MNRSLPLFIITIGLAYGCSSSEKREGQPQSGNGGSTAAAGFSGATGATAGVSGVGAAAGAIGGGGFAGAAGAAEMGGVTGPGGAIGTGGLTGTGGANGAGGTNGAGGATSNAGAAGSGGVSTAGGAAGAGGTGGGSGVVGPCDIYRSGGTPCVAAHSTVRALVGTYDGKLYQVRRSDNTTKDIVTLTAGGFGDGAAQDAFCSGSTCVVTVVYDQSGRGNDLWYQGSTQVPGSNVSLPATATKESLTVNGHKVYSLYIDPHVSYWRDGSKTGMATGAQPEGMYMITSGTHYNGGCCFDYGNSETDRKADGAGAMDAIYFGSSCWFGGCSGSGPWVQADLEYGLFPGGSQSWNPNQKALPNKYVTAMLKNNGTTSFALKAANAQSGAVTTLYDGKLPNGYSPMKKQGAIVLGSGGDCCKPGGGANDSAGTFYEGAIVSGYPSDQTENAIQDNVIAARYGSP
jgi:hypothetical protein